MSLVCIFAHPDDEAFGPSGTIAKFASHEDVYLICVTNGNDKSQGPKKGLMTIREGELKKSARVLGIKEVFYLNYEDGSLCNHIYHDVAAKLEGILKGIRPDKLLTFEPRGLTGHCDHIFLSMVTSYLYEKLPFIKQVYYFCNTKEARSLVKNYFIYYPEGYDESEIDEKVDVSEFLEQKTEAIKAHESQKGDGQKVLNMMTKLPNLEYFLVKSK